MQDAQQDQGLTIAEAAAQLGVRSDTVRRKDWESPYRLVKSSCRMLSANTYAERERYRANAGTRDCRGACSDTDTCSDEAGYRY